MLGGRADERGEQRMRGERLRFEFGVKLAAEEPRMIGGLDDFNVNAVGRLARNFQTCLRESRFVIAIEFIAMAVALGNFRSAIRVRGERIRV